MALYFHCQRCGREMVKTFSSLLERVKCEHCGEKVSIPPMAETVFPDNTYDLIVHIENTGPLTGPERLGTAAQIIREPTRRAQLELSRAHVTVAGLDMYDTVVPLREIQSENIQEVVFMLENKEEKFRRTMRGGIGIGAVAAVVFGIKGGPLGMITLFVVAVLASTVVAFAKMRHKCVVVRFRVLDGLPLDIYLQGEIERTTETLKGALTSVGLRVSDLIGTTT